MMAIWLAPTSKAITAGFLSFVMTRQTHPSEHGVNSSQKVDHCGNEKVDHPKVVKSGCFLHFLSQFIVTFPETVGFHPSHLG